MRAVRSDAHEDDLQEVFVRVAATGQDREAISTARIQRYPARKW